MRFSQEFIEKVREANDLVEIISPYTELKGGGSRLMGRCPFPDHSDKSPSFSVSGDNQLYYCYGCKKGGNVFTFLETFNGMSFPEAVEFLARRASIPIPENENFKPKGPSRDQKELLLKINRAAAVFFHQQLKSQAEDSPVRQYLIKRGLDADTVEKFRIGVALDEWQGLVKALVARKVPLESVEALGLIKPRKNPPKNARPEETYFDLFRDRMMFPIFNATGDVIGFGGRTLQPEGLPKYLNSSDSPVFNKSRVLYGIHETGKFIRAQDSAIVVEGYMDAIALYTAGIKNVVAILGTAFTPEHAKILKRYSVNVTMLLDGDEAGLTGAERSLPILLEAGLMAKGFALPDKMDPDDFVKANGADRLRDEAERAPELFSLLLNKRWMKGYHGSPSEKVRIVEEAAVVLARMQNLGLQELYMMELARQLDVEIPWVRKTLALPGAAPTPRTVIGGPTPVAAAPAPLSEEATQANERLRLKDAPKDEGFVLSLILHYENLMRELIEAGPHEVISLFGHAGVREMLEEAIALYQADPSGFDELVARLTSRVDQPGVLLAAMAAITGDEAEGFERKLMSDYMTAIRRRSLKNQGKSLVSQLKNQGTPAETEQRMEEFMALQRSRMGIDKDPS